VLRAHQDFLLAHKQRLPHSLREEWLGAICGRRSHQSLKHSTAESFGYEWKRFHRLFESYKQNFLNYIQPYRETDLTGKIILDAGCGVGRHTYWAAKFGAQDVIGMDVSDAVEPAERNCRELTNAHIVQADIYHPPFRKIFDYIFSIGVLHHLPDPEKGFRSLARHCAPNGVLLLWVYGRKHNNAAVYLYEPLRFFTRRLPKKVLMPLCHPFAFVVELLNQLSKGLEKIPGMKRVARKVPFYYYTMFPYEVKVNDAFDVLATPKSRYYRMETIRGWFERAGFQRIRMQYLRKKSIIASGSRTHS
jgi:SAM-dependent methyltransferase